jgi:hypothetical protein
MRPPGLSRLPRRLPLPAVLRPGTRRTDERAAPAAEALTRSEARLATLESKGQALASITATIAAAIGLAISLTWPDSTTFARCLLTAAAAYALKSLHAPLVLAGPLPRPQSPPAAEPTQPPLPAGIPDQQPQEAALNRRTARHLSNLLATSRRDLLKATLLITIWAVLALLGYGTKASPPPRTPPIPCRQSCIYVRDEERPLQPAASCESGRERLKVPHIAVGSRRRCDPR